MLERASHAPIRAAMDDLRAGCVDPEIDPREVAEAELDRLSAIGGDEEEQETAPARTQQLPAQRPGLEARTIHLVDGIARDRLVELPLELPRPVQQVAE